MVFTNVGTCGHMSHARSACSGEGDFVDEILFGASDEEVTLDYLGGPSNAVTNVLVRGRQRELQSRR